MKMIKALALLLVLAACGTAPIPEARYSPSIYTVDLNVEYDRIVDWIYAETSTFRLTTGRPTVLTASRAELQRITEVGPGLRAAAAYCCRDIKNIHVVLFADDFDPEDPGDKSIAIHEVLHSLNRWVKYPCDAAAEAEAYELQARYLEQVGTSLFAETGLDAEAIKRLTSCE